LSPGSDLGRIRRIKYWIGFLTLLPSAVLLAFGLGKMSLGYFAGGLVVFLNLLGTEQVVRAFVEKKRKGRVLFLLLYMGKLALTAGVIGAVLILRAGSPVGLVLGISTLLIALMFDFFLFGRDIEGEEES
jgi:hypothetical protein